MVVSQYFKKWKINVLRHPLRDSLLDKAICRKLSSSDPVFSNIVFRIATSSTLYWIFCCWNVLLFSSGWVVEVVAWSLYTEACFSSISFSRLYSGIEQCSSYLWCCSFFSYAYRYNINIYLLPFHSKYKLPPDC